MSTLKVSMSPEDVEKMRLKIEEIFAKILAETQKVVGDVLPDYKLASDYRGCCVKGNGDRAPHFYTVTTGEMGPEGARDRSHEWIRFNNPYFAPLEMLSEGEKAWLEFALMWTEIQEIAQGLPE